MSNFFLVFLILNLLKSLEFYQYSILLCSCPYCHMLFISHPIKKILHFVEFFFLLFHFRLFHSAIIYIIVLFYERSLKCNILFFSSFLKKEKMIDFDIITRRVIGSDKRGLWGYLWIKRPLLWVDRSTLCPSFVTTASTSISII